MGSYMPPRKAFNRALARDPDIQAELSALAQTLEFQARNRLAQHFDEGQARIIRQDDPNGIDRLITLEDRGPNPDALAIEFGHWTVAPKAYRDAGFGRHHFVEGLNILGSLVGRAPRYKLRKGR